jgi:hypothetical protein
MALGCQPIENKFTPGFFMVILSNATGGTVKSVSVRFEAVCRNDQDRSSSLDLMYSSDGTQYVAVAGCSYVSPEGGDEADRWEKTLLACRFRLEQALSPGACLWLKWRLDDAGGSGSRDEYGIDNLAVTFHAPEGTVISVR